MKKINSNSLIKILLFQIFIVLMTFAKAHAYIGLGPLLPMLGTIIAYIFIGVISIFGIILYPLIIVIKKKRTTKVYIYIYNDISCRCSYIAYIRSVIINSTNLPGDIACSEDEMKVSYRPSIECRRLKDQMLIF